MPDPVERTSDGRYIVVDGRKWRASDPAIPEHLRTELVGELMSARRDVRSAKGTPDEPTVRARVHAAKVALGERGEPWWDTPTADGLATRVRATLLCLARRRNAVEPPERAAVTIRDAAEVVAGTGWRSALELVEQTAQDLVDADLLVRAVTEPSSESVVDAGRYGQGANSYRLPTPAS